MAAPLIAIALRDNQVFARDWSEVSLYASVGFAATFASLSYFRIGSHLVEFFSLEDGVEIAKACFVGAVLAAVIEFSLTRLDGIPRSLPAIHFLVLTSLLIAGRSFSPVRSRNEKVRDADHNATHALDVRRDRVVLVGSDHLAWLYVRALAHLSAGRPEVAAVLDVGTSKIGRKMAGYTILGDYSTAQDLLDEMMVHGVHIDRVVVASSEAGPGTVPWLELSRICESRRIDLEFLPAQLSGPAKPDAVAGPDAVERPEPVARPEAVVGLEIPAGPEGGAALVDVVPAITVANEYCFAKRATDVVVCGLAIILLLPLFALVMLLVASTFGAPLLFWQERIGRNGRPIHVHKFRSLKNPFDRDGRRRADWEREAAIGRLLRFLHLDELPQLFDVLLGEMSLVGPRPLLPVDQPSDPTKRLTVRPGLTGWAQIHGGKSISIDEKTTLDEWYVDNATFTLDIKIMILTAKLLLVGTDRRTLLDRRKRVQA